MVLLPFSSRFLLLREAHSSPPKNNNQGNCIWSDGYQLQQQWRYRDAQGESMPIPFPWQLSVRECPLWFKSNIRRIVIKTNKLNQISPSKMAGLSSRLAVSLIAKKYIIMSKQNTPKNIQYHPSAMPEPRPGLIRFLGLPKCASLNPIHSPPFDNATKSTLYKIEN